MGERDVAVHGDGGEGAGPGAAGGLRLQAPAVGVLGAARRALLYVNYHQPWFEDKKNWVLEKLLAEEDYVGTTS